MNSFLPNKNVTVLGAGSWGITLAVYLDRLGYQTTLWEFDCQAADRLASERIRAAILPGISIPETVLITSDLQASLTNCELAFLVLPSHAARTVLQKIATLPISRNYYLVSCIKGIENGSLLRMTELVRLCIPSFSPTKLAVLSGPSHAEEVSRNIPTAVVIASESLHTAEQLQEALASQMFRLYTSPDVIGVELGGSLKNVIAIAAGICDGAGFGDNTKAALQPRGLAEITRLGKAMGAEAVTFSGLSGMGDLIVTCMSRHSRNRYVGEQIGKGLKLPQVLQSMSMVAEGVRTCRSAVQLAKKYRVEMPICREVYHVLFEGKSPSAAVGSLMTRTARPEAD
ncbi:MAG TPA: NAD(P)H-dependent glycerol-3-phosphate dehydrogenase [bacterium]|nr:NAD(P)H-dependent glycerol-3-phosphate dehydrogenase [bacterium]HNT66056.1 NAD(P)H-dependent glycerol-3-phosphate dehydrogenase [bacterium]